MIKHDTTIMIRTSPAEVFDVLVDIPGYDRWTEMRDGRLLSPGPPRVGSRAEFRLPGGPLKGTFNSEIVALEPGRRVAFDTTHPALRWRSWADLEPVPKGTSLHYYGEITMRGWRRILEPLLRAEVQAGERKEVERLKALVEGAAASARGMATTPSEQ